MVEHQIDSLDVVIANTAMTLSSIKLSEIEARRILPLIDVIAYGQLDFFNVVLPLLRKAENKIKARFMYMSSIDGGLSTYGASKALGNFFVKWLSLECQDIIT
jgi:norsolorinic acid ketoreductase